MKSLRIQSREASPEEAFRAGQSVGLPGICPKCLVAQATYFHLGALDEPNGELLVTVVQCGNCGIFSFRKDGEENPERI